jgi:hypothetical protein
MYDSRHAPCTNRALSGDTLEGGRWAGVTPI